MNISANLFLANLSHEIRTPLNGIVGYVQLLTRTKVTDKQRMYLKSVENCSLQLLRIINDVIDCSKLISGQIEVREDCFAVEDFIQTIQDATSQEFNSRKQIVKYEIADNFPSFLVLDRQKWSQIMVNLLHNASKYSGQNTTIRVILTVEPNLIIKCAIIDQGIGISEEDQQNLFQSFFQVNHSDGSGLGLAICKKLLDLIDGTVEVKSTLGEGSSFIITLPFKEYQDYKMQVMQQNKVLLGKFIIVVDDNVDNRLTLSEMLLLWGMKPITTASAKEAIHIIRSDQHDLCVGLIDICMPGMTGIELASIIKNERPLFPLIALSSAQNAVSCFHFESVLQKPINSIRLFGEIYKAVNQQETANVRLGDDVKVTPNTSIASTAKRDCDMNLNILIAEDVIYNQNILTSMIEELGFQGVITVTNNGKEAWEYLKNHNEVQLILLDLIMPVQNGFYVLEQCKKNNHLAIIVIITASVLTEQRTQCKDLGANYFLHKPIILNELKNILFEVSRGPSPPPPSPYIRKLLHQDVSSECSLLK